MPRLGVGMPIIAGLSQEAVTTVDDFFFESHTSGEVTPINTATRTNLLTNSHDFSQSSWTKADSAISASTITDPFGGTGSYKLTTSSASNQVYINETITSGIVSGASYTFSVFAQKAEYDFVALVALNPTTIHYFNLANGTTASAHGIQPVIEDAGNGWFRCSVTVVADNSSSKFFGIYLAGDSGSISLGSVADGNGVYIYGAQVEQNAPVSALITSSGSPGTSSTALNDTSEVWDFDSTDLMLEADPEDEGFWEEGSNLVTNHDYEDLGSELVDFPNASITLETGWSFTNGILTQDGSGAGQGASADAVITNTSFDLNKQYKFTITVSSYTSGDLQLLLSPNSNVAVNINGTGDFTVYGNFQLDNTLHLRAGYSNFVGSISNISIKQVDPNDRWSLTNTTISDGVLNFPDNSSAAKFALHSNTSMMDIGSSYEITLTVNKTAGGVLKVLSGTGASVLTPDVSISSSGTQTFRVTNNTNGGKLFLYTTAGENFQGTVDNVTVREYAVQPKDI